MKKRILIVIFFVFNSSYVFSQREEVLEGDFKSLKGISAYNLLFDYSNIQVPHYASEKVFLETKLTEDERETWFSDREIQYEPMFIERFNKQFKKGENKVGKYLENAKYIMKIHTTYIYSGYGLPVFRSNSKITAIISIYNVNDPINLLLKVKYFEIDGEAPKSSQYDSGYRISKAYGKLGKLLANNIKKYAK